MAENKSVQLAFLITATDNMSRVLEDAGKNLTGFQKKVEIEK
jgi:hypothetical protein